MNKLRKPDTLSPTKPSNIVKFVDHGSNITELQPYSAREQLWATRALKAEALLAAQENHHRELKTVTMSQELKRTVGARSNLQQGGLLLKLGSVGSESWKSSWNSTRRSTYT